MRQRRDLAVRTITFTANRCRTSPRREWQALVEAAVFKPDRRTTYSGREPTWGPINEGPVAEQSVPKSHGRLPTSTRNSECPPANQPDGRRQVDPCAHLELAPNHADSFHHLVGGDVIACAYADLPRHFATFLPLAGISTVKEIKNNPIDVKATGRLNKLYVELLKDNPDWATEERRHELNQFMARLIFCFFAEDRRAIGCVDRLAANCRTGFGANLSDRWRGRSRRKPDQQIDSA